MLYSVWLYHKTTRFKPRSIRAEENRNTQVTLVNNVEKSYPKIFNQYLSKILFKTKKC